MAAPAHTVSTAFVRSAVRVLASAARAQVLQQAGIAEAALAVPDGRVPATAFGALWMAVAQVLDDEFFGLDRRRMKVGSFALLCHAVAQQTTVERALRMALRGFALCLDDIGGSLSTGGGEARIELANRIGEGHGDVARDAGDRADARRFAEETLLVMVHGLLCWMAGRRVPLLRLDWAHPQPAHADEYRRMFSADVRFDRPVTAIAFDVGVLQAPVSVSDASLKAFLRDAPQSVFLKQVASGGWAERARRHLRRSLSPGAVSSGAEGPTLEQLADRLGVSAATLRRRLDGEGTHWQQLKDEVRRDLAIQHLADRTVSVEQVAAWLGFNDGPSFHRAFRKWTGSAPGAYRSGRSGRTAPTP